MIDVLIGECHLDIRRSADSTPWLDDDDHRTLAQRVQRIVLPMIEELLAPRLAQGSTPAALPALDVRISLTDVDLAGAAPLGRTGLRARLARATELGLAEAARSAPSPGTSPRPHGVRETAPAAADTSSSSGPPIELAPYLERVLAGRGIALSLLTVDELVALLSRAVQALDVGKNDSADAETVPAPTALAGAEPAAPSRAAVIEALVAAARLLTSRLTGSTAAATDVATALRAARPLLERWRALRQARSRDPELRAPIEHVAPAGARRASTITEPDVAPDRQPPRSLTPRSAASAATVASVQLVPGRHAIDHVLPFLAVATLTRHGVCDALALDADEPSVFRTLLAAAALKCLPRDRTRGGHAWGASARHAAALAAALAQPPSGADFLSAIERLPAHGAFARAAIAAALADSLRPHGALPLVAAGERLALFDPDGLYPVSAGSPDELAPFLRTLDRTLFLESDDPAIFASLAAAELRLIAAGPAAPRELAVPVAGPGGWRGRATRSTRLDLALRARLPAAAATAERAAEVWRALVCAAPLAASATHDRRTRALDELAALLAGFALADIGWALSTRDAASWREPDPLLVMERFADLGGWLDVDARQMTVVLPLGRRFTDLRDAGLLDTVKCAASRDHRRLAFTGS